MLPRLFVRSSFLNAFRGKHFLADVPLRKRGVTGPLPENYFDNKVVMLYFGAGWCGSCKILTKKLKKFHEGLGDKAKDFEIVYIGGDKEEAHLLEYYENAMPAWTYVPFGDPHIKEFAVKFKAAVLPVVKIVNADGNVVNDRARADVEECVKKDPSACLAKWKQL